MTLSPNPKAHIASNLIRASAVLYLVYYYLNGGRSASFYVAFATCTALFILLLMAFFVRQDYKWPKWVLLGLLILTMAPDAISLPATIKTNLYAGLVVLVIDLLQLIALILLFMPYHEEVEPDQTGNEFPA